MSGHMMIDLPWPSKSLSPNARLHWSRVAAAKKTAKRGAFYSTKAVKLGKIDASALVVKVTFFPPDLRRRDADNMISSMKAAFDGISEAVGVDDSKWQLQIAPVGEVVKGGKVKIELEWRS